MPEVPEDLFKEGLKWVWNKYQDWTADRAMNELEEAEKSSRNPNIYQFLKWKYNREAFLGVHGKLLERCDKTYSVVVFRAPSSQRKGANGVKVVATY